MIIVYAENLKTNEILVLGEFATLEEAQYNVEFNLEWDEDDIIEDWNIFTVEELWIDDFDECGFDPYAGCCTEDC